MTQTTTHCHLVPNIYSGEGEHSTVQNTYTRWTQKHSLMYLEMLTNCLIPQLAAERHDYLFQQDGAPPHWHPTFRTFLNEHSPNRWIGRTGQNDQVFCKCPPPRPEITGPDRLWLFPFVGTWRTESTYSHYLQPWMSCRNASTRSCRICCRESGPS
jgi:hypothetical protein